MTGELKDPRREFGAAVTEEAGKNPNVVVFSADSGKSSGFSEFIEKYGDRYFECGIMEQGVIGMAAGMATAGKIPVFCAIAPFTTARPFEMFRNDLGYMHQNVKVVGRNCGLTYADLGATHQSLDDFGIIRMIPGVTILAPQDPTEIRSAVKAMIAYDGPVYMRIGSPKIPVLFDEAPFEIGKGRLISDGDDLTIISTGSETRYAMEAVKNLDKKGIHVRLIGMPTVWPVDRDMILDAASSTRKILTVEEHYAEGGLGSIVTELCSELEDVKVRRIGVPREYATTGTYEQLLSYYGLDAKGIQKTAEDFIG